MNFTMPNFYAALPEIFVLVMICVVMMADLFMGDKRKQIAHVLTQITIIIAFVLTLHQVGHSKIVTFDGLYVMDNLSIIAKLFILGVSFFVFLYSRDYLPENKLPLGEYHLLGLFALLGMMVMVSADNFISMYLGLEVLSLPLYAMVALKRDSATASEAAMKYFIMGALASGMLLYGISMVFGATNSLEFATIAHVIATTPASQDLVLIFGMVFIIAGIAFKLGIAPFHMWVPDVYDGSPVSVTLFITSAPKIAGLIMAIRILVDGMPGLHVEWQHMLIFLAVLSILIGNLIAIAQTNIKRMLAYSSIAHMGYMTLGLIAGTAAGYASALFYVLTYAIMSVAGFGMIVLMSKAGFEAEKIEDLQGLNSRNSWLALMMLIVMFSMAGIPPTVGFFAKLGVLEALVNAHFVWLAVYAILMALVGLYYYLRVVKVMYFEDPMDSTPVRTTLDRSIAITINGLGILFLGIFPDAIITLCRTAF